MTWAGSTWSWGVETSTRRTSPCSVTPSACPLCTCSATTIVASAGRSTASCSRNGSPTGVPKRSRASRSWASPGPASASGRASHDERAAWGQVLRTGIRARFGSGPRLVISHAPPLGAGDDPRGSLSPWLPRLSLAGRAPAADPLAARPHHGGDLPVTADRSRSDDDRQRHRIRPGRAGAGLRQERAGRLQHQACRSTRRANR